MTEKRVLEVDGDPLAGLVNVGEYEDAYMTVRVPGPDRDVPVKSHVRTIPEIDAVFKVQRNSETMRFLENWYKTPRQTYDVTEIYYDGGGDEFARKLWQNVECTKFNGPGYDASAPTFAQVQVRFAPENIIFVEAE